MVALGRGRRGHELAPATSNHCSGRNSGASARCRIVPNRAYTRRTISSGSCPSSWAPCRDSPAARGPAFEAWQHSRSAGRPGSGCADRAHMSWPRADRRCFFALLPRRFSPCGSYTTTRCTRATRRSWSHWAWVPFSNPRAALPRIPRRNSVTARGSVGSTVRDHLSGLGANRGRGGCLMHVEAEILHSACHESRSFGWWSIGLGRLHGTTKGRALNMR